MANPPFNVDEVNYERVKDDPRFNTYGILEIRQKSSKKDSDKKKLYQMQTIYGFLTLHPL